MSRPTLRFTPFHAAAAVLLFVGLALGVYHGLEQLGLVPLAGALSSSWVSWSHIHVVTVGGFAQLLVGMLPQVVARWLDQPAPSRRYTWASFVGLNGGLLLAVYGRGWGHVWAFDAGLAAVWLVVAALLVVLVRLVRRSDRPVDAPVALALLSPFVFLWGLTLAYGLFGHGWSVPGGWPGVREAHVHANAWGFLALAAIGVLSVVFPRLAGADLHSERLRRRSAALLGLGIVPLVVGPLLGLGRTVTATGLVLYAAGYAHYLLNLVRTYRAGDRPALARWLLVAQGWILAPAGFAPFVLFGVEWLPVAYLEQAALHFFFVGWALPVALAGLALSARTLPTDGAFAASPGDAAGVVSGWMVPAWTLAVVAVGVGFLAQDAAWSPVAFALGWPVIAALWALLLARAVRFRRAAVGSPVGPAPGGD